MDTTIAFTPLRQVGGQGKQTRPIRTGALLMMRALFILGENEASSSQGLG